MMLDHMELYEYGDLIRNAIFTTIERKENLTRDLKGSGSTTLFTESVCNEIIRNKKLQKKQAWGSNKEDSESKTEEITEEAK